MCLYFVCSGTKRYCFFISVPSCRYFQTLLPNCTAYSIFLLWSKYLEQQWARISLQYKCFTWNNRSTSQGWSICTWLADSSYDHCVSLMLTSALLLIEHDGGAPKCIFRVGRLSTFTFTVKDKLFYGSPVLRQHNQLPNVFLRQDGFECDTVSCCSGVTFVWRCFSMQIHC